MIDCSVIKDFSYVRKFPKGSFLVQEGDMRSPMYIILKGRVYIASGAANGDPPRTIGPGEHFGEQSLFLGAKPLFSALSLEDVIALPLSADMIHIFIKREPDMAFEIMKALVSESSGLTPEAKRVNEGPEVLPKAADMTQQQEKIAQKKEPERTVVAENFSLFPEGHGSYTLDLNEQDKSLLMSRKYSCPLCKNKFSVNAVRQSKLIALRTDLSMRTYYKGVEPLYYDVVTCPGCLYSALTELFEKPDKLKKPPEILSKYRKELSITGCGDMDISAVFARYYLALVCAPLCFRKPHLITAKLSLKLSRIYHDCGDEAMEKKYAKQALDTYLYAYQHVETAPDLDQQLCMIIGELSYTLGDITNARKFLYKVKTNKNGSPALKRQAEDLIEDILAAGES